MPSVRAAARMISAAARWFALSVEIVDHDRHLSRLTTQTSPTLREGFGIGADTAAELLIICGDTADRIHAEAAFAKLCGACPIPASSGMTTGRHRLYRGGHRQANAALHRTVIVMMLTDHSVRVRPTHGGHRIALVHASRVSVVRPTGILARRPSPIIDWSRNNACSTRACCWSRSVCVHRHRPMLFPVLIVRSQTLSRGPRGDTLAVWRVPVFGYAVPRRTRRRGDAGRGPAVTGPRGTAAGLALPAPAAPDRRPAGPRRRAVPVH